MGTWDRDLTPPVRPRRPGIHEGLDPKPLPGPPPGGGSFPAVRSFRYAHSGEPWVFSGNSPTAIGTQETALANANWP